MSDPFVEQEFQRFSRQLEADPLAVFLARSRRDAAMDALKRQPGVAQVLPSGSLARGTQARLIHDVDLIVVFEAEAHPEWHGPGSADAALDAMQRMIAETLQRGPLKQVHSTEKKNHVVKAELEPSWGPLDGIVRGAPPMDFMPAVRKGTHLRVPERLNPQRRAEPWIEVNPEKLQSMVAERTREWENFDNVVRMVDDWASERDLEMPRLGAEVLVLKYTPRPGLFKGVSVPEALAEFFEQAAENVERDRIVDPAGLSGEIAPGLDYRNLREALEESAELAKRALEAEKAWKIESSEGRDVPHPSWYWQRIFGEKNIELHRDWDVRLRRPEAELGSVEAYPEPEIGEMEMRSGPGEIRGRNEDAPVRAAGDKAAGQFLSSRLRGPSDMERTSRLPQPRESPWGSRERAGFSESAGRSVDGMGRLRSPGRKRPGGC